MLAVCNKLQLSDHTTASSQNIHNLKLGDPDCEQEQAEQQARSSLSTPFLLAFSLPLAVRQIGMCAPLRQSMRQ
jgi:hypothetical protein